MKAIKKPVEIECMILTEDSVKEVMEWCPTSEPRYTIYECDFMDANQHQYQRTFDGLVIHTLEGDHLASVGDYIIKGVQGEFYPCKPDIFKKTYEMVND